MATVIPPDFAEVSFRHQFVDGGTIAICTMGMDLRGGEPSAAADLLRVTDAWATHHIALLSNAVTYLGTQSRVGVANGDPVVIEVAKLQAGGNVNSMLTRNTAALVKKTTARGGRRGRGRYFLPAVLQEAAVDQAGNLTVAMRNLIQTAATDLYGALKLIAGGPVLLHDDQVIVGYSSTTGKPVYGTIVPGPPDPITALTADTRAATQRRRMR